MSYEQQCERLKAQLRRSVADHIQECSCGSCELLRELGVQASDKRNADRIDGYDRDDLGESPDH